MNDIIDREIKGRAKAENICIHNSEKKSIYLDTDFLNSGKTRYVNVSEDTSEKDIIILWDGSQAGKVYRGTPGALGSTLKAYTIQNYTLFYYYQLISNQEKIYQQYRTPNIPHVIKSFTREFIVTDTHDDEKQLIIKLYNNLFSSIAIHQRKPLADLFNNFS